MPSCDLLICILFLFARPINAISALKNVVCLDGANIPRIEAFYFTVLGLLQWQEHKAHGILF